LAAGAVLLILSAVPAGCGSELQNGWRAFEKEDYQTALQCWQPLAESGQSGPQFYLGLMYDQGLGVAADSEQAARWYRLSADQGFVSAQNNLGLLLCRQDAEANRHEARQLF
jgi:TPR repeat protein